MFDVGLSHGEQSHGQRLRQDLEAAVEPLHATSDGSW